MTDPHTNEATIERAVSRCLETIEAHVQHLSLVNRGIALALVSTGVTMQIEAVNAARNDPRQLLLAEVVG